MNVQTAVKTAVSIYFINVETAGLEGSVVTWLQINNSNHIDKPFAWKTFEWEIKRIKTCVSVSLARGV